MLTNRKILQDFMDKTKQQIETNLQLVKLDGDCPDEKLLQTGKFKEGKKEDFQHRKEIDLRNESRPSWYK